jgi:hypothetical protein
LQVLLQLSARLVSALVDALVVKFFEELLLQLLCFVLAVVGNLTELKTLHLLGPCEVIGVDIFL